MFLNLSGNINRRNIIINFFYFSVFAKISDTAFKIKSGNELREARNLNLILFIFNNKFILKRGISEITIGRYIIKNIIKISAKKSTRKYTD